MKYIQLEPQADIAIIKINRPEALNALNTDVIFELSRTIDIIGVDDDIKAVIITGAGERSFCATGKMISAEEAEQIGLVNKVIALGQDDILPPSAPEGDSVKEKERSNQVAKILNKKLMEECILVAQQITGNSFTAVKTSKMLINRGMDADIATGLRLEIYGWALCFAHEDRQRMMSAFLNKGKK